MTPPPISTKYIYECLTSGSTLSNENMINVVTKVTKLSGYNTYNKKKFYIKKIAPYAPHAARLRKFQDRAHRRG